MPLKDPEKQKEYVRKWRLKNKERMAKTAKEYYIKNEELYKQYRQTNEAKKKNKILTWKRQGIMCFDFDLLYDLFISTTNCEFCKIKLTIDRHNTSTTRCLDHDHNITDKINVRGVLCISCNNKDVLKSSRTNL